MRTDCMNCDCEKLSYVLNEEKKVQDILKYENDN